MLGVAQRRTQGPFVKVLEVVGDGVVRERSCSTTGLVVDERSCKYTKRMEKLQYREVQMNRKLAWVTLTLTVALILAAVSGCSSDVTQSTSGNVRILLTDAPIDFADVTAVNVTLEQIVLFQAGEVSGMQMGMPGVTTGEGLTVNLLDYQDGVVVLVGAADVPTGDYLKLRLLVSAAELARDDDGDPTTADVIEPILVPSSKVDVPVPFTLSGGMGVDITLDFDAELSVQVNNTPGQNPYILRPVINLVDVATQ